MQFAGNRAATMSKPASRADRVVIDVINASPSGCDCGIKGGQQLSVANVYSVYFTDKISQAEFAEMVESMNEALTASRIGCTVGVMQICGVLSICLCCIPSCIILGQVKDALEKAVAQLSACCVQWNKRFEKEGRPINLKVGGMSGATASTFKYLSSSQGSSISGNINNMQETAQAIRECEIWIEVEMYSPPAAHTAPSIAEIQRQQQQQHAMMMKMADNQNMMTQMMAQQAQQQKAAPPVPPAAAKV